MSEIIIIEGKIPDSSELYKVLLELSQSYGLAYETMKAHVIAFSRTVPSMNHLAEEYKRASETMKDLVVQIDTIDNFPPAHVNPVTRQYKRNRR